MEYLLYVSATMTSGPDLTVGGRLQSSNTKSTGSQRVVPRPAAASPEDLLDTKFCAPFYLIQNSEGGSQLFIV